MTLFITGSESFIGRALLAKCEAAGIKTVGVDGAGSSGVHTHKADIRDPNIGDLIPEGATVIHLAAISRDPDCRADPRNAYDVNVNGTLNVAEAAKKRGAAQFIFASSEWVYGDVRNDELQTEDQPIDITTIKSEYAFTKIVAEQALRLIYPTIATTVLRFGIVYGPRAANWSAVESIFNSVRTLDEVKIGSGATARRFIHIADIVSGILAARGRSDFEIFNLSGDRPITLAEVVKTGADVLGKKVNLIESNAAQASVRNPANDKARAELKWKPAIDLRSGLESLRAFFVSAT
jgi:UDP-glucose 4-epimerase